MDETWILQRFLARDEEGLAAAYAQLGPGLTALAARIAGPETAEECVNDALLAAWQAIPPLAPVHLAAYLAKLTRNAALNRYRAQSSLAVPTLASEPTANESTAASGPAMP